MGIGRDTQKEKRRIGENNMKFLVTGVAGFIGSCIAKNLLDEGYEVIGIDDLNNYYTT